MEQLFFIVLKSKFSTKETSSLIIRIGLEIRLSQVKIRCKILPNEVQYLQVILITVPAAQGVTCGWRLWVKDWAILRMKTVHTIHPLLEVDTGPRGGVQQLNVLNSVETALIVMLHVGEGHNPEQYFGSVCICFTKYLFINHPDVIEDSIPQSLRESVLVS